MNTARACSGLLAVSLFSATPEGFQTKSVTDATATSVLRAGVPAPDFAFTDLTGKPGKLSDYRGKVVLLDFWGSWCGPCVEAMPELIALYDTYHARGFEILGIADHTERARLLLFVAARKIPWRQVLDSEPVLSGNPEVSWNVLGPIVSLYRVTVLPGYFLIGTDGTKLK